MKWPLTLAGLVLALVIQTALGLVFPREGRLFDPFLLVVVYLLVRAVFIIWRGR